MGDKVIAVDFGGTSIRAALMSGKRILRLVKKETLANKGSKTVLKQIRDAISEAKGRDKIKGLGVASPGPLLDGVIKNPPNLPLRNFNLKRHLKNKFKVRVEVENDANCAALAELHYGVKKKNFIVITLGTGVGGGIVINKELYVGEGYASELGHMILEEGKDLEFWASGSRVKNESKRVFGKKMLAKELRDMGNRKADRILHDAAFNLGKGIGSLINIFDPEVVVLTGGLKAAGKDYIRCIRAEAQKYSALPKKVKIEWSKLEHAGILGASLLLKK